MIKSVRNIYGAEMLSARAAGRPHVILPNSTLNELLYRPARIPFQPANQNQGMYATAPYNPSTDTASLEWSYVSIGFGGHTSGVDQPTGVSFTKPQAHLATDAALYRPIPWLVVPIAQDLSPSQAAGYRLRKTMVIDGALWVAYYARLLNITASAVTALLTTTTDGVATSRPFVPTTDNLEPTPPNVGTNTQGNYVSATVPASIPFSDSDFVNIQNAVQLLYGNVDLAMVSEIAICSGLDKPVITAYSNVDGALLGSAPVGYVEAVGCQCAAMFSFSPVTAANSTGALEFDIGCAEPLYGATT